MGIDYKVHLNLRNRTSNRASFGHPFQYYFTIICYYLLLFFYVDGVRLGGKKLGNETTVDFL